MDKDKLRKADIFSGGLIFLSGAYIVSQALRMPMKDSWGGVQNVWYVSPAIFPLFVGAMIMLLGGLLVRTAIKEVGFKAVGNVGAFIGSSDFIQFLKLDANLRFYAIVTMLLGFVFLFIPRVDFFLTAILFLNAVILMFYVEQIELLKKLFVFNIVQMAVFLCFLLTGLNTFFSSYADYPGDILVVIFIFCFSTYGYRLCRQNDDLKRKYKTAIIVAFAAPIFIGIIFKYFLLVPMPFEGMVVESLDAIWYR